jgi:hypothetical protein
MHTTKDYASMENPREEAIKDLKKWLGTRKFNMLSRELKAIADQNMFENLVGIAGVSGYPVRIWFEEIHKDDQLSDAV